MAKLKYQGNAVVRQSRSIIVMADPRSEAEDLMHLEIKELNGGANHSEVDGWYLDGVRGPL